MSRLRNPSGTARRLVSLIAVFAASAVNAATTSSTFSATSTVISTCSVAAGNLAFGNYTLTQLDSTGTLTVTCTFGTGYAVALDAGTGSGATVTTRKMTGPASQTLNYSLYQDAARSTVWGQTAGSNTVAGTGSGAPQTLTVYGRVGASQASGVGLYTDTVTVTLTY